MPRALKSFTLDTSVTAHKLAPGTLRRIIGFARPYRGWLVAFLALIVVDALAGAAGPLIYRAIIDQGIAEERPGLVVALAGLVALLALVSAIVGLAQRWFSARIGEGLVFDLRTQVFDHVQRMPIGFFTRAQTGALVTRLNSDVQGAQQAFTSTLSNVVGNVVGVTATLAAMFVLSWQITLLSLVLLPLFVLPARLVGRKLAVITRERYQLNGEMGQMMTERFNVSGALLVKLFGRPESESDAFSQRAGRVRDIGVTQAMYSRVFMSSLGLLASLAIALAYGLGGVMAIGGTLGVGTVVALTAYLGQLYGPLTSLSNVQVDIMTTLVSFERVLEVLDLEPMVQQSPGATPLPRGPVDVEFRNVDFRYPTAADVSLASLEGVARLDSLSADPILHDVSFQVGRGRMVAIVGPSGAGKTTIAGLVSRLYDPVGGIVRIGGVDLRDATTASVRDTVGVVSQDAHLFHETLRANLRYAKPDGHRRRARTGVAVGADLGCDRAPARRFGHRCRRSRPSAVRRREAADRHRPVAVEGPGRRRPRRGDRPPRLHVGVSGSASARSCVGGTDVDRDRPPSGHGPRGRRDHRRRRRSGRGTGHPRAALGARRPLRNTEPHPVR